MIARGIERRAIFASDDERAEFLDRLSTRVTNSGAGLYAWGLMPNHFHLFVSTGTLPLSRFMQGLLGGYVEFFNQRHRRSGHLFQNRFKSTLVEQERYGLELVRYIHLNPVRSGLGVSLDDLDRYPWTGHAVLLGHRSLPAQNVDFVLQQFGATGGAQPRRRAPWGRPACRRRPLARRLFLDHSSGRRARRASSRLQRHAPRAPAPHERFVCATTATTSR